MPSILESPSSSVQESLYGRTFVIFNVQKIEGYQVEIGKNIPQSGEVVVEVIPLRR